MNYRRLLTYLWVAVVGGVLVLWLMNPSALSKESFESLLTRMGPWAFAGFVLISLVRGALLIPSTPVVLAGGAFFPNAIPLVLLVSMAGIVASATLLYRFPGFAGYDSMLAEKYPEQLGRLRRNLVKPGAVWLVAAWSFFPAVPTDLICYAAGLVGMPYRRMILGLVIGELPLVTAYVLLGTKVAEFLP